MRVNKWWVRLCKPAGEGGESGGGSADRGDDFIPTEDGEDVTGTDADADADAGLKTKPKPTKETPTKPKIDPDDTETKTAEEIAAEAEAEAKDTDKKGKGKGSIPMDRHTAVLERERQRREAVERELQRYQGGAAVAQANADTQKLEDGIVALEREHAKLITDGEHEKAADVMSKIRRSERSLIQQQAEVKVAEAEARAAERVRYDVAVERLESAYPVLNPDHADYDDDTMKEVVELKNAYQLGGRTPTEAMQKAVKVLLGSETSRQAAATTVKPKVDADDVEQAAADDLAAARRREAVERAERTSKQQPPTTARAGIDSDKAGKHSDKAVSRMSFNEFSKLDDKELSRLRGDIVTE